MIIQYNCLIILIYKVAYFKLGENDRVNTDDLRAALDGIPAEVISSLESQVANVGRS